MKKLLLSTAVLCLLLSGCNRKDDTIAGPVNGNDAAREAILTSGKWRLISATSEETDNGLTKPIIDEFALLDACEKDNSLIFRQDRLVETDEGTQICNPANPQKTVTGQWRFISPNGLQVSFYQYSLFPVNIETLDEQQMIVKVRMILSNDPKSNTHYKDVRHIYQHEL